MKTHRFIISVFYLITLVMIISCSGNKKDWTVTSPSGNIRFTIAAGDSNNLFYSVYLAGTDTSTVVINTSPLGLRRNDGTFVNGLSFVEVAPVKSINEKFKLITGKQREIESIANELKVTFKNRTGAKLEIIARAYDDGIAFRYCFPETDKKIFTVEEELTGFAIEGEGRSWIQPYDKVTKYSPAYETYYENGIPIGTPARSIEGWAFPALFNTKNAWLLLTEAAVDSSYFAAHLQQKADKGLYTIRMPEEKEANNVVGQKPSSSLPWITPWRIIIIGKELSAIVESNMVVKLNPPSLIADESWIKPGRASWSWWSDWPSPKDFSKLKKFVDLAAEMGWEYSLVDANWDLMEGGNIEQLVKYAGSKNVGILMWYNSGGAHNSVTERPRDIMSDPVKRKEEFKKLAGWGVKGVKVDFFQSDKPLIIKQYLDILKDAADNRVLVNFHGCTLPRGWNSTWPNLLSMEGVRGAESYGFDSLYSGNAVWHNTILPFTRNVTGSMDYTPVTFSDQRFPHLTSYGHELALSVVFESGILHMADNAEAYRSLPADPKNFLRKVPVVWDETKLLAGDPGRYCVIARRNGNTWYLGGINGTNEVMTWEVDLSRLGKKDFSAYIITDGDSNRQFKTEKAIIRSGGKLKVSVLPFGGFAATLNQDQNIIKN